MGPVRRFLSVILIPVFSFLAFSQVDRITIAAGTPEDQALTAISNEQDAQKKLAMYEDFVQKFSSNPAAVAYGNWQMSQLYQNSGDLQKAVTFGDKALTASPRNLDILVSQASIAQQLKDNAKTMDYALRGGEVCSSIPKQPKPEGVSDQDFAARVEEEKTAAKNSCEFLEAAAFNVIASEPDAKARMAEIERFTPAFPNSRFQDSIGSYAMMSLSELKDTPRVIAYGEKTLASDPNNLPALLLLAGTYVDDPKPGSAAKAITYAQKAVDVAKADAPDADRSRKISAGAAYSTLGYANLKQDKTAAAIPQLKSAAGLLKGLDDQQYSIALFRLGFAYAKLNKVSEAREALTEAAKINGPVQRPAQELLAKVNAARSKGK
ncbi:MAG TPA: tetratricopeptide repeat protein [Terriglobales bacterium]|nr:tetratricopeptide repeat protein [Terriglobales bacterium]